MRKGFLVSLGVLLVHAGFTLAQPTPTPVSATFAPSVVRTVVLPGPSAPGDLVVLTSGPTVGSCTNGVAGPCCESTCGEMGEGPCGPPGRFWVSAEYLLW